MIYITGDTHADFKRFNMKRFPEQREMTRDDYIIITGDFGGVWEYRGESKQEKYILDWLEDHRFTLLFIDGNHENFDRLHEYPVKEWHGGVVHEIRPHLLHLMRGYVFDIDGKKIFAFGGARSHDIDGGVLSLDDPDLKQKMRWMNRENILYRIDHYSWWADEFANEEEMKRGMENLKANGNKVDYIITHCCPSSTQALFAGDEYKADDMTDYLDEIKQTVNYEKWFFGHYHDRIDVTDKDILLYDQIIRIK